MSDSPVPAGRAPTVAFYPGSFDPLTIGHMNIIERGLRVFDRVIVALARNVEKQPMFTLAERKSLIEECFLYDPRVTVLVFDGLMVEAARLSGASVVLRGVRGVADFEYEFQMSTMNNLLAPQLETIFMMTEKGHFFISSKLVREVAGLGGDVSPLVPPQVFRALQEKHAQEHTAG
ncbi:MAG: pantetheine-phosphate adenylyltransferase [Myxococcota bacterium]